MQPFTGVIETRALKLPTCDDPCPLSDFLKLHASLALADAGDACHAPKALEMSRHADSDFGDDVELFANATTAHIVIPRPATKEFPPAVEFAATSAPEAEVETEAEARLNTHAAEPVALPDRVNPALSRRSDHERTAVSEDASLSRSEGIDLTFAVIRVCILLCWLDTATERPAMRPQRPTRTQTAKVDVASDVWIFQVWETPSLSDRQTCFDTNHVYVLCAACALRLPRSSRGSVCRLLRRCDVRPPLSTCRRPNGRKSPLCLNRCCKYSSLCLFHTFLRICIIKLARFPSIDNIDNFSRLYFTPIQQQQHIWRFYISFLHQHADASRETRLQLGVFKSRSSQLDFQPCGCKLRLSF